MSVQQGMDVSRVRQIAEQLARSGESLASIGTTGRAQLAALGGAWEGPDLEKFDGAWGGAEKSLADASASIQSMSKQLGEQAGQQDEASSGSGSVLAGGGSGGSADPGGPGGPGTRGAGEAQPSFLDKVSSVVGAIGALDGANDIVKALNGGKGLGALLARVPSLAGPVLSPGTRLGLYMQAQLAHPQLGRGAAALFGNERLASLFNSSKAGALVKGFGRVMGPLAVGVGGYDLIAGIADGDWSQAISGGMGLASVAAPLLLGAGPVGWAVAGGLAIGSFVVSQWGDDIADGAKKAWNWTGDRLSDLGEGAKNFAEDAGSVLSSGADAVKGLFS